jgi:hypothetical protein
LDQQRLNHFPCPFAFRGRAPSAWLIPKALRDRQVLPVMITLHNSVNGLPRVTEALGDFLDADMSISPEQDLRPTNLTSISARTCKAVQCLTCTGY